VENKQVVNFVTNALLPQDGKYQAEFLTSPVQGKMLTERHKQKITYAEEITSRDINRHLLESRSSLLLIRHLTARLTNKKNTHTSLHHGAYRMPKSNTKVLNTLILALMALAAHSLRHILQLL
jgi:hypothetical protein